MSWKVMQRYLSSSKLVSSLLFKKKSAFLRDDRFCFLLQFSCQFCTLL